jgi:hypothetical protein
MSPFAKGGSFILNLKIVIEKCKKYNALLNILTDKRWRSRLSSQKMETVICKLKLHRFLYIFILKVHTKFV